MRMAASWSRVARYRGDTGEIQARYRARLEDGGELVESGGVLALLALLMLGFGFGLGIGFGLGLGL